MQIYLARNNQQAGPYSLEQINQMLASQQVLLTDLAWHQGMTEWKALGELTQGKLVYEPIGYVPLNTAPETTTTSHTNPSISKVDVSKKNANNEQASLNSRILAKILDLFLWIPAAAIPSFFLNETQVAQLSEIQKQMQNASNSAQAVKLQEELFTLIPIEAWQMVFLYIIIMLAIQAFFLVKSGQSLGKKLLKIKIVDAETGAQVSLTRVFLLRSVVFIILNFIPIPFVTIVDHLFGLNKKRQTLHDKLAKTKVVKQ